MLCLKAANIWSFKGWLTFPMTHKLHFLLHHKHPGKKEATVCFSRGREGICIPLAISKPFTWIISGVWIPPLHCISPTWNNNAHLNQRKVNSRWEGVAVQQPIKYVWKLSKFLTVSKAFWNSWRLTHQNHKLKEILLHSTPEAGRPKAKLIKWTPKTTRSLVLACETMEVLQIRDFYYQTECLVKNMSFLHNWDKYRWA